MKFERTNGCGGVVRLMYHEAGSFEEGRSVHPDEGVVIHQENRNAFGVLLSRLETNSGQSDKAAFRILFETGFVLVGEDAVFDRVPELDFHGLRVDNRRNRLALRKRGNIGLDV